MDTTARIGELEAVRVRRAEMGDTLDALARALNDGDALDAVLVRLRTDFALHIEVTEGPEGLHHAILAGDLRLANQVQALAAEHAEIAAELDGVDEANSAQVVLDRLVRHRQRGADLIREAYDTDIGGGD